MKKIHALVVALVVVISVVCATASTSTAGKSPSPTVICTNGGCDSGGLRCYFGLYHELICI